MLRPSLVLLAAILTAACGSSDPASGLPAPGARADDAAPQLRRDGRWLLDGHGRVVLIHGVNAVWKRAPLVPPDAPEGFTAADAQWLRDHGFNGARIGTLWSGVMPHAAGEIDSAYLEQWDRVIQLMAAQRIWMLFDFHQDMMSPEYQGEGVPEWAVEPLKGPLNTLPPPMLGFPFNYFTPQVSELFDNLWADQGSVRDGFRGAWRAVAARWRDQPYHMGYDLLNEPWSGQEWPQCLLVGGTGVGGCPNSDRDEIQPFLEQGRLGIREVDADNLVWFEPQLLSGGTALPTGLVAVPGDAQVGYSFHNYCPHAALLQSAQAGSLPLPLDLSTTCAPFIEDVTAGGEAAAARMEAVAAMTEFGASDDLTIIGATAAAADANFTSWFYWHYKNWADPTTQSQTSGAQGMFTDDTDFASVKLDKLRLLERTYPQATAGIPVSMTFDPDTGAFAYRYTPRAATAPTEIFVPVELHYPQGYAVEVSGGAVRSAPGASPLVIENLPGATEVTVVVRRP
ncbi:MAG TPA: cellulase family glycosylhydrolase [Solimonas sp.]|nr:cellulase family glycosylhydrolase [Solimonas sp.]